MILIEVLASAMGAYIVYKLEKIDKRQDLIEIDLAIIKMNIPKRSNEKEQQDER